MSTHVVPVKIYFAIFATLLVLTFLTVFAAYQDLGQLNVVVAVAIAVTKATLVVLFFMHVKYSDKLTWVVVISGIFFLGIMLALTLADYFARSWLSS